MRLELVASNALDDGETGDLVELAWQGRIAAGPERARRVPRAALGDISVLDGESLVYWLRKLVFRSAYLDHRVKAGLLRGDLGRGDRPTSATPTAQGGRALLELAPTPTWARVQFRRFERD